MTTSTTIRGLIVLGMLALPFKSARSQKRIAESHTSIAPIIPELESGVLFHLDDSEDSVDWLSRSHLDHEHRGGFFEELFAPASHGHFSRLGTPFVHLFLTEPAVLHRDLFLDYRVGNNFDGNTDEQEFEMEYALTKRLAWSSKFPTSA
jgi:hypothetical protein